MTKLSKNLKKPVLICFVLMGLVGAVFGPALHYGFINYDDDFFVYANPVVMQGVTVDGVVSTLTRIRETFYYPLTVISFMTDVELYGSRPAGFHFTNILLHLVSVLLLFFLLRRLTGSYWRSALVAAVFAVHPLRVESVVWITERKDVLSGLFFMLTLHAYLSFVRHRFSWLRYALLLLLFAAGLLSKPMLVTVPFVLLLLDWWPLNRIQSAGLRRVVVEKIPLVLMTAGFSVVTLLAETSGPSSTLIAPSFAWRFGNALVSSVVYIRQFFLPVGLALPIPLYELPLWKAVAAAAFLLTLSWLFFVQRKKRPILLCGWLWYLGMLFPVSGIPGYLGAARADRFTYLPQIGLALLVVWFLSEYVGLQRSRRLLFSGVAMMAVLLMAVAARIQAGYWEDNVTLWSHSLNVTSGNIIAHNNLGVALGEKGEFAAAADQFKKVLDAHPKDADAWLNLGFALTRCAHYDPAVRCFKQVLEIDPDRDEALKALGAALILQGDYPAGIRWTRAYLELHPEDVGARRNLNAAEAR